MYSQYMGVAIAWPRTHYSCTAARVDRVADLTLRPAAPSQSDGHSVLNILGWISRWGAGAADPVTHASDACAAAPPSDTYIDASTNEVRLAEPTMIPAPSANPWAEVRARENQLLSVRLSPLGAGRSSAFCVSVYHMPCVFWHDDFMRIHGALAAQVGRPPRCSAGTGHLSRTGRPLLSPRLSQAAADFAGAAPHVVCGDWNAPPSTGLYTLL